MEELCPISVLVRNERGVLSRVAGLFSRRGFNITSLAVGETENPEISRITVVVSADPATLDQICKQLNRLVSVISTMDLHAQDKVERGLALIKVRATPQTRAEIIELANIFRARIDHVDAGCLIVEVTGDRPKVEALKDLLSAHGIIEMVRTGQIVMARRSTQGHSAKVPVRQPAAEKAIFNISQAKKKKEKGA